MKDFMELMENMVINDWFQVNMGMAAIDILRLSKILKIAKFLIQYVDLKLPIYLKTKLL